MGHPLPGDVGTTEGTFEPRKAAAGASGGPASIFSIDDIATRRITLYSVRNRQQPRISDRSGIPASQRRILDQANASDPPVTTAGTMSVSEAMKFFIAMAYDPKRVGQFRALQVALYRGGMYGSKKPEDVLSGTWDTDTADALSKAIRGYLQVADQDDGAGVPISFDEYVTNVSKGRDAAGKAAQEATPKKPLVYDLDDPAEIAGQVQQAAQSSLGRNLSDAEVQHFVSEFMAQQRAYQKKLYDVEQGFTSGAVSGGTFEVNQPDLEGQAEQYVKTGREDEIGGNQLADYVGAIQQLLGGL